MLGITCLYRDCGAQVPSSSEDTSMADKEAILATLNIKAMTFDDTFSALTKSTIDKEKDIVYI